MNREKKQLKKIGVLFVLIAFCASGVSIIMRAADAPPTPTPSPTPIEPLVVKKAVSTPATTPAPTPEQDISETVNEEDETVYEETPETPDGAAPTPTAVFAEPEPPVPTPSLTPTPSPTPEPPEPPAPPAVKETSPVSEKPDKPVPAPTPGPGIDTIDIEDGGNWLLKRKALEDTVNIIEDSNALFTKILQASTDFKVNRNKLDSEYDVFIATIGFNLGDFDQLLTMLLDDLEKEREDIGDLSADERAAIQTINEKKNELEQLQSNLKALGALDDELDTVISTVDTQIKTANNYQNQAWKNFQTIKKVLSDEKADELYYQTEGLYKSMQEIYSYLTQNLSTYFSGQMQAMRNQMNTIKSTVKSLQQKGVDLQKNIDQLEQQDEQAEQQRLQMQEQEAIRKAVAQAEMARKKASWLQTVKSAIFYPFNLLKSLWSFSTGWIRGLMGQKPQATDSQPEVAERDEQQTPIGENGSVQEAASNEGS